MQGIRITFRLVVKPDKPRLERLPEERPFLLLGPLDAFLMILILKSEMFKVTRNRRKVLYLAKLHLRLAL